MLNEEVTQLNDKKLSILLFLMDFNHQKATGEKLFGD